MITREGKKFLFLALMVFISTVCLWSQTDTNQNPNGYNKFYYPNGKLSSEGPMRDGKPDGYWKTYHTNGNIKSEGNRKDFQLDSTWKFYNDKGKITYEYTYKAGKKTGPVRTYNSEGWLESEDSYVNNIKDGTCITFYKNAAQQKVTKFIEGREEGVAYEYDSTGTIITIIEYKAGFIKSLERINRTDASGKKQGLWKDFWPNGKVKTEVRYLDDLKHGYFKEFNEVGNLVNITKIRRSFQKLKLRLRITITENQSLSVHTKTEFRKECSGNILPMDKLWQEKFIKMEYLSAKEFSMHRDASRVHGKNITTPEN
jgi:antitoxin component YwqK of YwqJK toxin-antitoxin module